MGIHAQNMKIILDLIVNIIRETYMTIQHKNKNCHIHNKWDIFIRAPKIMMKVATTLIWIC